MDEVKIEFPCNYPIKVIVLNDEQVVSRVLSVISDHDQQFNVSKFTRQPSRAGNYVSVRVDFWATGKTQLQDLFTDLKKIDAVRMVL